MKHHGIMELPPVCMGFFLHFCGLTLDRYLLQLELVVGAWLFSLNPYFQNSCRKKKEIFKKYWLTFLYYYYDQMHKSGIFGVNIRSK